MITSPTHAIINGNITVAKGSNVILRCEATDTGKLEYQWKKNEVKVPSADNVRGRKAQNLNISNITDSNSGKYQCVAGVKGMSKNDSSMDVQVVITSE